MKAKTSQLTFCLLLISTLSLSAQTYVLTDLGSPEDLASFATGINSNGVVVGYSIHESGMTNRAWKWTAAGGRVDLGGFGGLEARALGINQSGAIVATRPMPTASRTGCLDRRQRLADIGTLPGGGNVFPKASTIAARSQATSRLRTATCRSSGPERVRSSGWHVVGRRRAGLGDGFRA